MSHMTDEQVRNTYISQMGRELGEVFHALEHDLTWMHWRWQQYRILFAETPSRLDLLNQSASFFFYLVHRVLFEDTLLGIARLVSGEKSAGHDVLTIQRLENLVGDPIRPEVSRLIEAAKNAAGFAVGWRNNLIAHRSLDLALRKNSQALPDATREKVEAALASLREVLNCVEGHYCKAHSSYGSPALDGAKQLLNVLRDGIAAREERHAALRRGEFRSGPEGDI
jgi:AbiU2